MRLRIAGRLACGAMSLLLVVCGRAPGAEPAPDPGPDAGLRMEVESYVAADRASPPGRCRVLFVGSSSIVRWKPTLAGDMAPIPTLNRGFGGSQIEHATRWFDELVASARPSSIVFYAGDNDINAGKPLKQILRDFDAFMDRKTRELGDTPVYFISVKPSKARFEQLPRQSALNEAIRSRARGRADLHYIDVVGPMMEGDRLREIFEDDGLHLTRQGYEIWARVVKSALLPDVEAAAGACRRREKAMRRSEPAAVREGAP